MELTKLSLIFRILILSVFWIIIFFALRIMYKDIKGGNKRERRERKSSFGLEVIEACSNCLLRRGSVIPVQREVTIGRRTDNTLVLEEDYVSGHHAKIYLRNNDCILEDLGSTNGTLLNGRRVEKREVLKSGDGIKIGNSIFKLI